MKILFITTNLRRGGVEKRTLYLAKAARESGHEYRILTISALVEYQDLLKEYNLSFCSALGRDSFSLVWDLPRLVKTFRKQYKEFSPNIIQVFGNHALIAAYLAGMKPIFYGIANTFSPHWNTRNIKDIIHLSLEKRAIKSPRVFSIACSIDAAEEYINKFQLTSMQIEVVPNGVDMDEYPVPKTKRVSKAYPTIQVVGTLYNQKNHTMSLHALKVLLDWGFQAQLKLAGEGPDRYDLLSLANDLGIAKHVDFLGMRKDIPRLLSAADIYWMTSRSEGFGLVIVEAFASGTPVIAADVKGVRNIVKDQKNGMMVRLDDHVELAKKTMILWEDRALYETLISEARRTAVLNYSAREMNKRYLEIYSRISMLNERD